MNNIKIISTIIILVLLSSCTQVATDPTAIVSVLPSGTPGPAKTPLSSPTPTPEPNLLEEGVFALSGGEGDSFTFIKAESSGGEVNTDYFKDRDLARVVSSDGSLSVIDENGTVHLPYLQIPINARVDGNAVPLNFDRIESGFALYSGEGGVEYKIPIQIPENSNFNYFMVVEQAKGSEGLVLLAEQSIENSNDVKLYPWVFDASESISVFTGDEGLRVSVDGQLYTFNTEGQEWQVVEVKIPEGAENHEQITVPDRYVTVVNEEGKTEEILESGVEVLMDENGKYTHELKNGQWVEYTPRVMVVGEKSGLPFDVEVPKEVIETAAETMKNAVLFQRVDDGQLIEVKTGLHEHWPVTENDDGIKFMHWYGVLLGAKESSDRVHGYFGVNLNNTILVIDVGFIKSDYDFSKLVAVFEEGVIPDYRRGENVDNFSTLGGSVNGTQIAEAIFSSDLGTPFYFASRINGDAYEEERTKVLKALEGGEFFGSSGLSVWNVAEMGASRMFCELAESK